MMADVATDSWHLDKRVPVALIVTLLAQFSVGVWFLSAAFRDIEGNRLGLARLDAEFEAQLRSLSGRLDITDRAANNQAVQLGRIEENISGLRSDINRLLNVLEKQRQ